MLELERNLFRIYNESATWEGLRPVPGLQVDNLAEYLISQSYEVRGRLLCPINSEKLRRALRLEFRGDCCISCGKTSDLQRCATCHKASYCSRECQTADWKVHKKEHPR